MRNRMATALAAIRQRKRGTASVVSVAAIGALALGTLGAGTAAAHGMIGSPDIKNQSINSWDIGTNQVGASELRGPAHDSGPAVKSHHVEDGSLGWWDLRRGTIGPFRLTEDTRTRLLNDGRVQENHLSNGLKKKVNAENRPPQGSHHSGEDDVIDLTAGERAEVGSMNVGPGTHLVLAQATVSSGGSNDNLLCYLNGQQQDMSVANAKDDRESFTLTALITNDSKQPLGVTLDCRTTNADGTATDVSMTGVRVSSPPQPID